jgi:hypothetical protein
MYAYLKVSTEARDLVRFPDGKEALVDPAEGEAVAESWCQQAAAASEAGDAGNADHGSLEEDGQARQAALAEWQAELDRRTEWVGSITQLRRIRADYEAEFPPPQQQPAPTATAPRPTVERVTWWCAECPQADLAATLAPADGDFPREELAAVLSDLQRIGWTVVHVSEDRLVEHAEESSRSVLVGASILLRSDD